MICYPMGLPQWDPIRQILDGNDEGKAAVRLSIRRASQNPTVTMNAGLMRMSHSPQGRSIVPACKPYQTVAGQARALCAIDCARSKCLALCSTGRTTWIQRQPACGLRASRCKLQTRLACTWDGTRRPRWSSSCNNRVKARHRARRCDSPRLVLLSHSSCRIVL
jgi:hypothetical protein